MQKIVPPNVLAGKPLVSKLSLGGRWHPCLVTRVYYKDSENTRLIWCDVEVLDASKTDNQKRFLRVALENLHHKVYPQAVSYSFKQEEIDQLFYQRLSANHACRFAFQLKQLYYEQSYHWTGVLATKPPTEGSIYRWDYSGACVPVPHYSMVTLEPIVPFRLCVKDGSKLIAEIQVAIVVGNQFTPHVTVSGDIDTMSTVVTIDGHLHSGRGYHGSTATATSKRSRTG